MRRIRGVVPRAFAVAAVVSVIAINAGPAGARPFSAARDCTGSWTRDASPSRSGLNALYGVWAASADELWAVGDNRAAQALVLHRTSAGWRIVSVPFYGTSAVLRSVSGVSSDNVWAVGSSKVGRYDRGLSMHWNGSSWKRFSVPWIGHDPVLRGVSSGSSRPTWAVGYADAEMGVEETQIFRRVGGGWIHVHSPNPGNSDMLFGVRSVSSTQGWAVGSTEDDIYTRPLVEYWDGASWTAITDPALSGIQGTLLAVATPSPTTMVAVGDGGFGNNPIVVTYDGATWSSYHVADVTGVLNGVSPDGSGGLWAVGEDESADNTQTVIEHDSGSGFARVTSPNPGFNDGFNAVTTRSNTSWAVGLEAKAGARDPITFTAYVC
jgi:hypothetical protein